MFLLILLRRRRRHQCHPSQTGHKTVSWMSLCRDGDDGDDDDAVEDMMIHHWPLRSDHMTAACAAAPGCHVRAGVEGIGDGDEHDDNGDDDNVPAVPRYVSVCVDADNGGDDDDVDDIQMVVVVVDHHHVRLNSCCVQPPPCTVVAV